MLISALVALLGFMDGTDWPQFRGPGNNSAAVDADLPIRWNDRENIAWRADLPGRGVSSPIIVGGRVFITATSGFHHDRLHVVCLDAATGRQRWERQFWATGRTSTHGSISGAAPTPASDGTRVYAFYSSNDLVCLDMEGNLVWYRGLTHDYPKAGNDVGMAASPALIGDVVVVQVESQGDAFAAGIDSATGETRWRIERPLQASWCSPIALPGGGGRKPAVLLQSASGISAHDVQTGQPVWQVATPCATVASSVLVGDRLYVPLKGLTALRLRDGAAAPETLWDANRLGPGAASPAVAGKRVFTVAGSIAKCGDAETGKVLWQLRLKGQHWATPVIAGGHMYCINEPGEARVIKISDEQGEVVAENPFGEPIHASPAVSGNALYVRSDKHLWKISKP
jgi:outer membrane protein assembly factor BamB